MDELLKEFSRDTSGVAGGIEPWHVLIALIVSFSLALVLAFVYRQTHRGISYSTSFVHTMVLMTITITVIMVIIGSNIARAFSLVGALSIIRFRTAIKEPRDIAFLFASMAVGMACGTGFPLTAALFTAFMAPAAYFLYRFKIGAMPSSEVLLKVQLAESLDYRTAFQDVFYRYLRDHALLSVETVQGGTALELVYSVHFKPETKDNELLEAVRAINGNRKVAILTGAQNVDV
jgi:uncharacterized membrane protein YhiD involved in acid resistance